MLDDRGYWLHTVGIGCFGGVEMQRLMEDKINSVYDSGGKVTDIHLTTWIGRARTQRVGWLDYISAAGQHVAALFRPATHSATHLELDIPPQCTEEGEKWSIELESGSTPHS